MVRYAGDLLADSLLKGRSINFITVFGLALNYDTSSAKLIRVTINFNGTSEQGRSQTSPDARAHKFL